MANSLYSFTGQNQADPSQAGYSQYLQQGQQQLSPTASPATSGSPINTAAIAGLAKTLAQNQQQPGLPAQLPPPIADAALQQGAQMNPNVGDMNMGGVGPTTQNAALAQGLMNQGQQPVMKNPLQQFMNPQGGS